MRPTDPAEMRAVVERLRQQCSFRTAEEADRHFAELGPLPWGSNEEPRIVIELDELDAPAAPPQRSATTPPASP